MTKELVVTEQVKEELYENIRRGLSMRESCREVGINQSSFMSWLGRQNQEEQEHYMRAREIGFIAQADDLMDWEERLLNGELDPNAARVAIDARKWRLGKMSKFLGDKPAQTQVNIQTNVCVNPTEALAQIMAQED